MRSYKRGGQVIITHEPEFLPLQTNKLGLFGRYILLTCRNSGRALIILFQAFLDFRFLFDRRTRPEVVRQLYALGIKSVGVVSVVALFTGMILALQTGLALKEYGQQVNIGTAVMVSMLREMGPFMTGLILAASVGAAIAAEFGTMTVSEEVQALEVMSISPVRFLVMPRLAAMIVMCPLLTFYACMLGILGGALVGMTQLGVSFNAYFDNAFKYAQNKDLYVGMFKSIVFGVMIITISSSQGFAATEGAVGVGRATRRSVMLSFLAILIGGYIITRLFYS